MRRVVLLLVAAVVAATFAVPAARAATSSAWTVVPSPNPPSAVSGRTGGELLGVACPTTTSCFVVGDYTDSISHAQPLIGRSIGTTWSIGAAPRPPDSNPTYGRLLGIACPAVTTCFAVGEYHSDFSGWRTLIERWNGQAWTIMKSPNPQDAVEISLSGIACPSVTRCFAVGYAKGGVADKTLIEQWDGTSWKIDRNAPKVSGGNRLAAVSCATTTSCVAVGNVVGANGQKTLIERWNGSRWTVVKSANPANSQANLTGVSCPSVKVCFAVGESVSVRSGATHALMERTKGETWSIVTLPDLDVADDTQLNGISCASPTACVAVGSGEYTTLIEHWDGASWSIVEPPDPNENIPERLSGVSCASAQQCVAVGASGYGSFIAQRNGARWSEVSAGASASRLTSVSCISASLCFAAGASARSLPYAFFTYRPLVERWDGTSWLLMATPNPAISTLGFVSLSDISCATATSCVAVGYSGDMNAFRPLMERWDGTRWSIVKVPDPPGIIGRQLKSVSCASPTSCFAVGMGESSALVEHPFLERWNGVEWTTETFAIPAGASFSISSVNCPSVTTCFAVGSHSADAASNATLVERWDGSAWSIMASPNASGATDSFLSRVSCPTITSCFAVGNASTNTTSATLVEQFDGTSWSLVPSPNPAGAKVARLTSVSCSTSTSCVALGAGGPVGIDVPFVERWDGARWSVGNVVRPAGATDFRVSGIGCAVGSCFAVGYYETTLARRTLVERSP